MRMQQSHHCGIETEVAAGCSQLFADKQQSHHCGIETALVRGFLNSLQSSNRTIVGLKLPCIPLWFDCIKKQQSHHCGIEIFISRHLLF